MQFKTINQLIIKEQDSLIRILLKDVKRLQKILDIEGIYVQSNTKKQIQRKENRSKRSSKSDV